MKKRIISLLLTLAMVLEILPAIGITASAASTITEVEISNVTYPEVGKTPQFTGFTAPEKAKYKINNVYTWWFECRPDGTERVMEKDDTFQLGCSYYVRIRVYSDNAKFAEWSNLTFTINGEAAPNEYISKAEAQSCYYYTEEEQTFDATLWFDYLAEVDGFTIAGLPDVPAGYPGQYYVLNLTGENSKSLYTVGGTDQIKSIEKVSGPDWLKIGKTYDGTWQLKGTRPMYELPAVSMTIKMTDMEDQEATATIHVGAVLPEGRVTTVNILTTYPEVGAERTPAKAASEDGFWFWTAHWQDLTSGETYFRTFEYGHRYYLEITLKSTFNCRYLTDWCVPFEQLDIRLNGYGEGNTIQPFTTYFVSGNHDNMVFRFLFEPLTYGELTGTVQYTSGAYPGQKVTCVIPGLPEHLKGDGATPVGLSYQWQIKNGSTWSDISGATEKTYVPTTAQLGKEIRLTFTGEGCTGKIVGSSITVTKQSNSETPSAAALGIEADGGHYTTLRINNYQNTQEYVYSTSKISDRSTIDWSKNRFTSEKATGLTEGTTYYVYTRFKETDEKQAGFLVAESSIALNDPQYLQMIDLDGYTRYGDGNTIYIPLGGSITIPISKEPSNAATWSYFTFGDLANSQIFRFNSSTGDLSLKVEGTMPASIRLYGTKVGSATLSAYYNSGMYKYGSWRVLVYNPGEGVSINDVSFTNTPAYEDVTLKVGDSFTPEAPAEDLMLPESASSLYEYKWYLYEGYNSISGNYPYGQATDNGYLSIDPDDGTVTALSAELAAENGDRYQPYAVLYLVKKTDSSKARAITSYKVTVEDKEAIALDSITVAPNAVTLTPGKTKNLSIEQNPTNAMVSGSAVWSKVSGSDKITVDASGTVTAAFDALDGATAVIQASLGGKTATCTVTVSTVKYSITVKNGVAYAGAETNLTEAEEGTVVYLKANPASDGSAFNHWEVTDGAAVLSYPESEVTYFTMPASDVTVKAVYEGDEVSFEDVAEGAYYYDAVMWAVENGITTGIDATHFNPNGTCTRAHAVTFLWRAAGSPAPESDTMPFTDVKTGSYYYDAVLWAVENGITKGTSATTFSPGATCSRAQIVTFLWRAQGSPAGGTANPFTDVKSDAYYADAVLWAVENSITKGTSATTFSPKANCTRAQIVTFIWRAIG